jgi:hypothetical protein
MAVFVRYVYMFMDDFRIQSWNPKSCKTNDKVQGKSIPTDSLNKERVVIIDKPNTKVVFKNGDQEVVLMMLKKENLAYDDFQRPEEQTRIKKIADNFHPSWGVVNVCESQFEDQSYFTVVDGQHRTEANPEDSVVAIVSNTVAPVEMFALGNSNNKNLTKDDKLWAFYKGYAPDQRWFFALLRQEHQIEPARASGDLGRENRKKGKFLAASNIYSVFEKLQAKLKNMKELKNLSSTQLSQLSRKIFSDLCDVMFKGWGKQTFYPHNKDDNGDLCAGVATRSVSGYRDMWMAVMNYLLANMGTYCTKEIIDALKAGYFKKNGRGRDSTGQKFNTIEKVIGLGETKFANIYKTGSEGDRQNAYRYVVESIVKTYRGVLKNLDS